MNPSADLVYTGTESTSRTTALPSPRMRVPGGRTESEVSAVSDDPLRYLAAWVAFGSRTFEYVYVIRAEGDSPIKIGKALDVPKRVAQLQTGNPRPLELLAVMPGGYGLEWQLHFRMKDSRVLGEWFDGEDVPDFIEFARRLMVWMWDNRRANGLWPDYIDFEEGWVHRRSKGDPSPAVIRYVEPDPEHVALMAERRRQLADREREIAERLPPPFQRSPDDWIAREYAP